MDNQRPFAQFIRTLGRGQKGSRSLSLEEAREAMSMIMEGHVAAEQLGAFLMLVRVKEETPEEVAGFVSAVRQYIQLPGNTPSVDIDWSSYAGKRRQLPWFLLSVLLLADNGYKVFMHGLQGRKDNRIYTPQALHALGLPISYSLAEAATRLENENLAYVNLSDFCPRLQQIIELRDLLGLRSPVHTVARMLNPFNAPCQMQGIFHPGYLEIHQGAAKLLEQPHMAVIKGDGGEIEAVPDSVCKILSVHEGRLESDEWPELLPAREVKPKTLELDELKQLWRGNSRHSYGEASAINTLAVALFAMRLQTAREEALEMANSWWAARSRDLI
jgi:anthranilate phosphoribosyltransferase